MNDHDHASGRPVEPAPARREAARPESDAVTSGAAAVTGTGGLGSAGGTDTTSDVGSIPRVLEEPEPSGSPRDDAAERGEIGRNEG